MIDHLTTRRIKAHLLKEFKDVFRDWICIVMLVAAPVTLYPAIVGAVMLFAKDVTGGGDQRSLKIGIIGEAPELVAALSKYDRVEVQHLRELTPNSAIEKNTVDLVLVIPAQFERNAQDPTTKPPVVELCFDSRTKMALSNSLRLNAMLTSYRDELKSVRLKKLQLDKFWWNKFEFQYRERKTNVPSQFAGVVPYGLIMMTLMSAYYASLSIITGEREKNTLSVLLTAGVDRSEIMLCKFIVVAAVTVMSFSSNLLSVALPLVFLGSTAILSVLPVTTLILVAVFMIPLVATVCAISMCVAAYARNYQQGGYYFLPFFTVISLFIGIGSLPNISIESILAFIPLINLSLCIQDAVTGNFKWPWMLTAWLSSIISAAAMVHFTSKLLEREDILFGINESPQQRRLQGSPYAIGCLLALVILAMVYVGLPAYLLEPVYGGIIGTQIVVIAIPALIFVRWLRLDWRSTFALNWPGTRFILAVLCLLPLEIYVLNLVSSVLVSLFPGGETYMQTLEKLLIEKDRPVWLVLLAVGLMPALCEELLFRGAVLGALNENPTLSTLRKCSIVGLAFGFIHLSILRFVPTTLMGIMLTWLRLRSRSIVPAMLLHFLNNSTAVLCAVNHWDVLNWGWFGAACVGLIGFLLLYKKL